MQNSVPPGMSLYSPSPALDFTLFRADFGSKDALLLAEGMLI